MRTRRSDAGIAVSMALRDVLDDVVAVRREAEDHDPSADEKRCRRSAALIECCLGVFLRVRVPFEIIDEQAVGGRVPPRALSALGHAPTGEVDGVGVKNRIDRSSRAW